MKLILYLSFYRKLNLIRIFYSARELAHYAEVKRRCRERAAYDELIKHPMLFDPEADLDDHLFWCDWMSEPGSFKR